jgi:hypothetical protein
MKAGFSLFPTTPSIAHDPLGEFRKFLAFGFTVEVPMLPKSGSRLDVRDLGDEFAFVAARVILDARGSVPELWLSMLFRLCHFHGLLSRSLHYQCCRLPGGGRLSRDRHF